MKKLHYGIISAASIVPRFVSALDESKTSKAWAIGASTLEKAKAMAKKCDIPRYYGSYEEIYQDPKVDVVYIATINENHYSEIMNAITHKKHVICEKPMVLSKKQAQDAFGYAKEQGVFLMEAQKSVFLPTTQFVKEKLVSKKFGELRQIQISASWAARFPKGHWMYEPHQGGVLFGSGSYVIELLLYLLDNPEFKYQTMTHLGSNGELDDVTLSFEFNGDFLASTHLSTRVHTRNVANFYFDKAMISINDFWKARKLRVHYHDNDDVDKLKFPNVPEMVYEVEHVAECIKEGLVQSPLMTEQITTTTVELVETIYNQSLNK